MGRLFDTKETNKSSSTSSNKPAGRLFKEPVEKQPSTLSKVGTIGKQITKAIVEPVATLALRPGQLAAETIGGMTPEEVDKATKKAFGDWVAPTPKNTSDVVKDVGRGFQTVSLGTIPKIGKFADIAIGGAIGGAGTALEKGGTDTTIKDIVKDTAIGTGLGIGLYGVGRGVSKVLGKKKVPTIEELGKNVEQTQTATKIPKDVIEDINNTNIPKTEAPLDMSTLTDTTNKVDIRTAMIKLEEAGYTKNQVKNIMKNVSEKNPLQTRYSVKDIADTRYELYPNKEINYSKVVGTKSKIKEKASFTEPTIPKTKTVNQPIKEIEEVVQQPKKEIGSKIKDNTISDLEKEYIDNPDVTNFNRGTFENWTNRLEQKDFNEILEVATGKKLPSDDIPANAYYSIAKNIADETGDSRLIDELSNSNVASKQGQGLVASKITTKNNTVDIVRDIKQSLIKKIKETNGVDVEQELSKQSKVLDKLIEDVKRIKPTREQISKILDNITC